jgi:hypothetical protein
MDMETTGAQNTPEEEAHRKLGRLLQIMMSSTINLI